MFFHFISRQELLGPCSTPSTPTSRYTEPAAEKQRCFNSACTCVTVMAAASRVMPLNSLYLFISITNNHFHLPHIRTLGSTMFWHFHESSMNYICVFSYHYSRPQICTRFYATLINEGHYALLQYYRTVIRSFIESCCAKSNGPLIAFKKKDSSLVVGAQNILFASHLCLPNVETLT